MKRGSSRKGSWLWLFGAIALLAGCQEPEEHPPVIDTCAPGMVCFPGSSDQNPGGGSTAGSGSGGTGAAPEVVRGNVRELVDDSFASSIAFTGQATVRAEGVQRGVVEAAFTGIGRFELRGFKPSDPLWLGAFPEANRGVLPTLSPVPLAAAFDEVDLGVVRDDSLELVFQLSTTSAERLAGSGQVILFFVDARNAQQGVAGITVSLPQAQFVSYGIAGSWSDLETRTDQTGLVVLANVAASAFPGSTQRIALSGRASGFVSVRVAADAVSLVEVPVE